MSRNYILESKIAAIKKISKEDLDKAFQQCCESFTQFYIFNYIVHNEAIEAFDLLDSKDVKICQWQRATQRIWNKYQDAMRDRIEHDAYMLLQDYSNAAQESLEHDIFILRVSIQNLFLRELGNNDTALARLATAYTLGDIFAKVRVMYFQGYKSRFYVDFSQNFRWADISDYNRFLRYVIDRLTRKNQNEMNIGNDPQCVQAAFAIANRISDKHTMNDAACKALGFSDKFRK